MHLLAVHLENLIFLLFILGALLFQLLTRAAGTASKGEEEETEPELPSHPRPPSARPRPISDEERIREFLEALGQPPSATPPPPVTPRSDVPPRPIAPVFPPREMAPVPWPSVKRELKREIRLPGQIPPTRRAKVFIPTPAEPLPFEVHETQAPLESPPAMAKSAAEAYAAATQPPVAAQPPQMHFASLLRSTSSLRDAIVLREIFGPPRSLQSLELTDII